MVGVLSVDNSHRRVQDLKGKGKANSGADVVEKYSFNTLKREQRFQQPSKTGHDSPELEELVAPHIQSFDALFDDGSGTGKGLLDLAVKDIKSKVVFDNRGKKDGKLGNRLEIKVEGLNIGRPVYSDRERVASSSADRRIFPTHAREGLRTYAAPMNVKIQWSVNGAPFNTETKDLGRVPVMVRSNRCNLRGMSSAEMVARGEESEELGGYFIVNGNEKLVRFLIVPRRNHVNSIIRPSFGNRGPAYTQYGVSIRSVRPDQTSQTNTLHYLSDGGVTMRFSWRKNEYMIPVVMVLKALVAASDKEIFTGIMQNEFENTFLTDRVELLLRGFKSYNLFTGVQCLEFLGDKFRIVLGVPEDWSNAEIGRFLVERIIVVHLKSNKDKFNLLLFMIRKLYALVGGECCADNPDSPQHQEILMPGFLYGMIIKEKLDELLNGIRGQIAQDVRRDVKGVDFFDNKYIGKTLQKVNADIGGKLQYFLATGNLVTPTGLDLQQASGYTIVAEKLNFYRYISHFRCVHRGSFFAELKTTTVRKLLPEAWGFLCPVHTPDGSPCGLLNHFAHQCKLVTASLDVSHIPSLLSSLGMTQPFDRSVNGKYNVCIQLDGRIIGWASPKAVKEMARALRIWKTEGQHNIPLDLEIGLVPESHGGQYPGLYLFSSKARMMRPVKYLYNQKEDHVGSFEQVYLDIAITKEEVPKCNATHIEFSPTNVLSVLANLTPFSDYNQSPRNMYQCQMGKQTMGTPSTSINRRTDNKMYRIQTGQTPIVRPKLHDHYAMDGFPQGVNAVVAVISYTGYDMEDAMIINKSALERGFGHGSIYKTHITDLKELKGDNMQSPCFKIGKDIKPDHKGRDTVDEDGHPFVGVKLKQGDFICAVHSEATGKTTFEKYKGDEDCYVDEVRMIADDHMDAAQQKMHVKLRIPRVPDIGDKFSSRHGQKGVCSQRWPAVDMPFSESGMQPDVIINPHAFPSRMTIGMFVESMAGKAGALHGMAQDATPFCFSEDDTPTDFFGEQLRRAGYNYYGNEPMYSGITGEEFPADIYIGLVYYQRLRHMVGDKWQVRTMGPVDAITRQPVKGRKKGGGIRFGEMERDALLAHGTAYLLQDRLMNCSDYSTAWVCRRCGSMVSLGYEEVALGTDIGFGKPQLTTRSEANGEYCRVCRAEEEEEIASLKKDRVRFGLAGEQPEVIRREGGLDVIAIPYVFKYLVSELCAMGINLKIGTSR